MIITVTLNAAIDKTLAVPNFRLGRRHRAVEQTSMAGGKGVNVARALKRLGQPVIARSEEHTSELPSRQYLVCRLLLEKKKNIAKDTIKISTDTTFTLS